MSLKAELLELLKAYGQEHLLRFWDELTASEQEMLASEIRGVNWAQVMAWFEQVKDGEGVDIPFDKLVPAPYKELVPEPEKDWMSNECMIEGRGQLRAGRVAAFTVAGGQGTRLGYDGPKGTYEFSILKRKSLFQYFAETLRGYRRKYNAVIPWYIMTSPANDAQTRQFFADHDFFGLPSEDIMFFKQGTLPVFDKNGKALLSEKCHLALAANGHGGSFAALHDSGALADMKKRKINIITYWQVDNPMVRFCDPLFIGFHCKNASDMSSRALIKRDAMEKLGHFCLLDGKMVIVEYSDMPKELLEAKDDDGRLKFRAGSPAIHVLKREFIERLTEGGLNLTPHRALKKMPYVDEDGQKVVPETPNAIKLEFFLFDALPKAKYPLVLEADRKEQFAAIKNAAGNDSPDSCRADLLERDCRWLEQAGAVIPRRPDGTPDLELEISPLLAVEPSDVRDVAASLKLSAGDKVYLKGQEE